jgi:site-specific DNA recombinase
MNSLDLTQQGKKPIGIWIRVSTEEQAQGESPQHHELRARHYAAARDWEVYDLAGVSGKYSQRTNVRSLGTYQNCQNW